MPHSLPLFTWRSAIVTSDLTAHERLVALVLSLHMSERGNSCWPSIDTTAEEAGLSYQGTKKILRRLDQLGWIKRTIKRRGTGRGTRVFYEAVIPSDLGNTGLGETCEVIHRSPESRPPVSGIGTMGLGETHEELPMNSSKNSQRRNTKSGCSPDCLTCEGSNFVTTHEGSRDVIPCPQSHE